MACCFGLIGGGLWTFHPTYKQYASGFLCDNGRAAWSTQISKSEALVPYYLFQTVPNNLLASLCGRRLPWQSLLGIRSWMRLRAGILRLRHVSGTISRADVQSCLFCNALVRNETVHVIFRCPHWINQRQAFLASANIPEPTRDTITLCFLGTKLGDGWFNIVMSWARDLDTQMQSRWGTHGVIL